jgi:hypothetical protein
MTNPYDVERSWPEYFLEHRRQTVEMQGTYQCGDLPVWTVHCPLGFLGNATIIEGDDGLIVYDTGVNAEAGAHIAKEIRKISDKPVRAIFYSHHHGDHYNGTSAIVEAADVESGYLTSVVKRADLAVYQAAVDALEGRHSNELYIGVLANEGVGIAPNNLSEIAPDELRAELEGVRGGIIDGAISVTD